jgi:hypothetical protein
LEHLSNLEIIDLIPRDLILNLFDPWWLAGFFEGKGSFQINSGLQNVFEIGQNLNSLTIFAIHKYFNVPSKVKVRKDNSYTVLSTKHSRVISDIIKTLSGKILGSKSFEFKVWNYAFNTQLNTKKEKAKNLLTKLRK